MSRNSRQWFAVLAMVAATVAWVGAAEWQPVESSWLDRAGYDEETQTLTIRMKNSSDVYEYQGVPAEVYREFLEAESKGGFFATKIQGQYPTARR